MSKGSHPYSRFWSVVAALLLLVSAYFTIGSSNRLLLAEAILSFLLLIHAWFRLRRHAKTIKRKVFLILSLTVPAFGCLWIGLFLLRIYSFGGVFDRDPDAIVVYTNTVFWQDAIEQCALALMFVLLAWLLFEWVLRRIAKIVE